MELAKNQEHTVTIEGYGEGGMGVARIDGRVVFVHGALRGEKCRVLILKTLKSVAFAKVLEVIEPSSERITPDCPYFPRCGGCTYRHIRYEEELRLKRQRVQDNLSRIGGSDVTVEEILGARDTLRYRNKAQYPVSKDGAVGFYRARTHEVIECEHCLLVKPVADAAAEALREYMQSCRVAGYDEKTGRGLVRHLYIRSNAAGESLVCVLVNGDKLPKEDRLVTLLRDACPKCTGIVLGTNTKKGNVILGDRYRTLWGSDRLEDTLCGKTFRLSVPSFYQVNRVQAERLYAKAIEFAGLTGQETVLDLYCGAGTITLALSDHAKKVLGAEIVPEAIDDARENAARNGVKNAEFFCGDASDVAKKLARENLRPDVTRCKHRHQLCRGLPAAFAACRRYFVGAAFCGIFLGSVFLICDACLAVYFGRSGADSKNSFFIYSARQLPCPFNNSTLLRSRRRMAALQPSGRHKASVFDAGTADRDRHVGRAACFCRFAADHSGQCRLRFLCRHKI